jgi:hypothetical protein
METLGNNFVAFCGKKNVEKYNCELCNYICSKKYNWEKHLTTARHIKEADGNTLEIKSGKKWQKEQSTKLFMCEKCNKEFQTSSGLWKHKQKCKDITSTTNNNSDADEDDDDDVENIITDKKLILMLINQNKELMEIVKNGTNNTINNNNNINSHNKTFNLQVFLNETCKDAMNISDFVESVKLQVSDLENVGKVGYIEGISNIIIKNLNALDVTKRPVHCTDKKREVMYVKDENTWEKEDEANKKLRKAIRKIAHKNICMFKAFREKYPDCDDYDSKRNSQYNIIVYEAMGGKGDNDYEKDTKIIKKIAKVVGIEKS